MPGKSWVDFKTVKERVSFERLLEHYGISKLQRHEDNLRGACPIHKGEGSRAFHVSLSKNVFHCFSCGAKGNVLDFVAALESVSVREAALMLQEWFGVEDGVAKHDQKTGVREECAPARTQGEAPTNPPLTFALRVDSRHEYGQGRGLSVETLEKFGAGVCMSRGMFAGRFVVPLHDVAGQLVGYAGRALDDKEPKYLFPSSEKGFHKRFLLFNLHRVIEQGAEEVVVVEGFFDCMKVAQAGFPCVGLLGSNLSKEQELLLVEHFRRVVLCFDGDAAGSSATGECLDRLASRMFVKAIRLPAGVQPDQLDTAELNHVLR